MGKVEEGSKERMVTSWVSQPLRQAITAIPSRLARPRFEARPRPFLPERQRQVPGREAQAD